MQQTLTQTITISIPSGVPGAEELANTGSPVYIGLAVAAILCAVGIFGLLFAWNRQRFTTTSFSKWTKISRLFVALFAVGVISIGFGVATTYAAPTLTLGANDKNISVTVPHGGGTVSSPTTATMTTANPSGYTLTAELAGSEPGITIDIKGGAVTTDTPLSTTVPLTLKTTTAANSTSDTIPITLSLHVDGTVTPGTKQLQLNYQLADNPPVVPPAPTTMQGMTAEYCQTQMTIYDGSNPEAVLSLTDSRGGTTRSYEVAKLADGKCWMLNNLKLGSTSSAITLTSNDSNVSSDFTLPRLDAIGSGDPYDTPYAYGPVTGDTGAGDTNYGYLYNFSAATAGETRTSLTGDGTSGDNAAHDICPANWRLPVGGYDSDIDNLTADNEFNNLSAHMAGFTDNQDLTYLNQYSSYYHGWQPNGAFKGSFAGLWLGGLGQQGEVGSLWSASAHPSDPQSALYAVFEYNRVSPGNGYGARAAGLGVRCLLN